MLLEKDELNKAIKILSKFISKIFLDEKNCNFLEEKISKLDNKINNFFRISNNNRPRI